MSSYIYISNNMVLFDENLSPDIWSEQPTRWVLSLTSGVKPSVSWESGSTSLQSLLPGFSATQWRREQVSLVRPRAAARWRRLVPRSPLMPSPVVQSSQVSLWHSVTSWSSNSEKFFWQLSELASLLSLRDISFLLTSDVPRPGSRKISLSCPMQMSKASSFWSRRALKWFSAAPVLVWFLQVELRPSARSLYSNITDLLMTLPSQATSRLTSPGPWAEKEEKQSMLRRQSQPSATQLKRFLSNGAQKS